MLLRMRGLLAVLLGMCCAVGSVAPVLGTADLDARADEIAQKAFRDTRLTRERARRMRSLKEEEEAQGHQLLRESVDMEEMQRAARLQLEQQAERQRRINKQQVVRRE